MQQTKKLQSHMTMNNAGQQQMELVKASQCLSELGEKHFFIDVTKSSSSSSDHFTVDADFTGIDAVEKDLQFVFKARHDIQSQAQDVLENGLNHLVSPRLPFFSHLSSSGVESSTDRHRFASLLQSGHTLRSHSIH